MKFYSEPNMLVRPRKTGMLRRVKPFRFDSNGVYETDNPHLIKVLSRRFKYDLESSEEVVDITEEVQEKSVLSEEEIRVMAKEKGIKSWHVKSIETLKKELEV